MPIVLSKPKSRSTPIAQGIGIALLLAILVTLGGATVAVYRSPQPVRLGPFLIVGPESQWDVSRVAAPGLSSYLVPRQPLPNATALLPLGKAVCLVDIGTVSVWKVNN